MDGSEEQYNNNENHTGIGIQCGTNQILNSMQIKIGDIQQEAPCDGVDCIAKEKALPDHPTSENTENTEQMKKRKLGKRKRRIASLSPVCPVCGLTLRYGEVSEHYEKEIKILNEFDDPASKSSVKWLKRLNATHNKRGKNSTNGEKSDDQDIEEKERLEKSQKRQEEYLKIKSERRLRHAKLLLLSAPYQPQSNESSSESHIVKCPICNIQIEGNEEERTHHVHRCLMKQEGELGLEDSDEESIEEYTWAGQTRIRATSLFEGGPSACGGDPMRLQMTNEDEELDIDGDVQTEFGLPQYTEKDIIPCSADIPGETEAQDRIRAAISVDQEPVHSREASRSRWSSENGSCTGIEADTESKLWEMTSDEYCVETVNSLKKKIIDLSEELHTEKLKCLICMEGFNTPLVSVVCWHVYCEECWMRTLGAKKLCPQCNTITSPSDLRRIFV